ncbi:MAG: sulfotransferase [bacterium]|nr:sulfotransferase [bacterium]
MSDFGAEDFQERLDVYLRSLIAEGNLSAMGRVNRCGEIIRFLVSRLRIQDQIVRHPQILDIAIERPIVITGFPRTGTTHLHNSLAADPALRYLPYWEAVEPVMSEAEASSSMGAEDPRIDRCKGTVAWINEAMPHFSKMHEMTFDHAHEEIDLLALDFSTMYLETPGPLETWTDYYRKHDQTPHYRYLYRVLQVLSFLRGGRRWVLKSPQHLEQLVPLKAAFPDATLALTHRDPLPVIASYATMMVYTARLQQERPDPSRYGTYVAIRISEMLYACQRDRDIWPQEQSIDIRFQDFLADQDRAVKQVYEKAGQPYTASSRDAIESYARTHPPGRHGKVEYSLGDFDLDPAALRASLISYCRQFGVREEI